MTPGATALDIDFQALFEAVPGRYFVLSPDLTIIAACDKFLAGTMIKRDEVIGRKLFEVFPDNPDDPEATGADNFRASIERVRENLVGDAMAVQRYDIPRPESEGGGFEVRYWSPLNTPVLDRANRLRYIIHRADDVTEYVLLKAAEEHRDLEASELRLRVFKMEADILERSAELQTANDKLRDAHHSTVDQLRAAKDEFQQLIRGVFALLGEERKRIANDIHDDTLQSVIVAQMRMQTLQPKIADKSIQRQGDRIQASLDDAVDHLRHLMTDLRQEGLRHGVAAALRDQLDELAATVGITWALNDSWSSEPSGVDQSAIYRIAREALVNIRKHVSKGRVVVDLCDRDDGWLVRISDEGPGFTVPEHITTNGHLGMTSMSERAEALGGWFHVESAPGSGTVVEAWIPDPTKTLGTVVSQ